MFAENPAVFLADFGVPCSANGRSFIGVLDRPDEALQMSGLSMQSTQYQLTVAAADVAAASLVSGVSLQVAGLAYVVRDVSALDDGVFFTLSLTRV